MQASNSLMPMAKVIKIPTRVYQNALEICAQPRCRANDHRRTESAIHCTAPSTVRMVYCQTVSTREGACASGGGTVQCPVKHSCWDANWLFFVRSIQAAMQHPLSIRSQRHSRWTFNTAVRPSISMPWLIPSLPAGMSPSTHSTSAFHSLSLNLPPVMAF